MLLILDYNSITCIMQQIIIKNSTLQFTHSQIYAKILTLFQVHIIFQKVQNMNIKNAVIIGDSYSTFKGFIPKGYEVYYDRKFWRKDTDVRRVSHTWWYQFFAETGAKLVLNNSWSGSTIGYTGYDNKDCSQTSSFIHRFRLLCEADFFRKNNVDTLIVFGGTNDSWCNAPLGELRYSDIAEEDLYSVLPAISCFFRTVTETHPELNVICIINTELKDEIAEALKAACAHYGVHALELCDIDKCCGHPTIKGMRQIKDQVMAFIENN